MATTTPTRLLQPRRPKTPQGDHPELFIHRRHVSASKRVITPSKSTNQLQGLYQPNQVHNPAQVISDAISRATKESSESLNARMHARSAEIESAFVKAVEMVMWNDMPKRQTVVKRRTLRRSVATKLKLPNHCFNSGTWDRKSRDIIEAEVIKQNSRPEAKSDDWKNNKYDAYLPIAQATPKKTKRVPEVQVSNAPATTLKRFKKDNAPGQLLAQYGGSLARRETTFGEGIKSKDKIRTKATANPQMIKQRREAADPFIKRKTAPSRKK